MKKLVIRFMLLSVPLLLLCGFTYLAPMGYMTTEYVLWQEEKDYVNQKRAGDSKGIDTVIIGDSRAKSSLMPERLGDGIYNIAIGGATPIEMYYAAKNYMASGRIPKRACIIFAPYHLCDIDNWNQTLFHNYLSVSEQAEVVKNALETENETVIYKGWLSDALSFRLRLPTKYLAQEYDAGFVGRRAENQETYDSVRADLGYCQFGSDPGNDSLNYETHHPVFDSSKLVLLYYDKLLSLLTENGVEVTVLQAPVNEASAEVISEEFLSGYRKYLEAQAEKYPQVTFETRLPVYENRYFGDSNHLNRSGAEKYSDDIALEHEVSAW